MTSNVLSDGGLAINSKGVCWGTVPNPTIANNHTNEGGGTGYYTSVLTNLDENSTYYVRAYATNSAGTSYSEQFVLTADYRVYLGFPRIQYNGSTYVIYPDLGSVMNFETAWAACENLTYGGFSDWFMPNINELYAMYLNIESIGGFNTNTLHVLYYGEVEGPYWSSSSFSCSDPYKREFCCFGTGDIGCASCTITQVQMYVRPVRKIE